MKIQICALRGRKRGDKYVQHLDLGGTISNALTTVSKDNYSMETENNKTPRPQGKGWVWDERKAKWFRIRRPTPREAFRLMGVSETDIDKIRNAGISDSQQYKMAGNSIVVDCLAAIFRQLFLSDEKQERTLF